MTGKEYLDSIFLVSQYVEDENAKILELREKMYSAKTQRLNDVFVKGSGFKKSPFEEYVVEVTDLEAQYVYNTGALIATFGEVRKKIERTKFSSLLHKYYIENMKNKRRYKPKNYEEAIADFEKNNPEIEDQKETLLEFFLQKRESLSIEKIDQKHVEVL